MGFDLDILARSTTVTTLLWLSRPIWSIWLAASQFFAGDMMVSKPHKAYLDDRKRIIQQSCRPTDSLGYTFHAGGMNACTGDKTHPSMPFLDKHAVLLTRTSTNGI
jgi:hypothetical protein